MLRELLDQNFGEIGRADGKATVLLATTGSLLGFLLARQPHQPGWTAVLWWMAATGSVSSLLTLLLAVLPRHSAAPRDETQTLAYFEDVLQASQQARLAEAIRDDERSSKERLLRALEGTSRIAHIKNAYIRWAVALLLPTVAASLGALLPQ
ncbi:Pycsar system effector family protein [Streptomyces sp. NPDC050315]|uniref:Pycsar system effector family protein n=1 Tax=Streptomyces sp. NPDC050315 TaxID=3155039 RepID=UPI0034395678